MRNQEKLIISGDFLNTGWCCWLVTTTHADTSESFRFIFLFLYFNQQKMIQNNNDI